jgi:hypothetical protein
MSATWPVALWRWLAPTRLRQGFEMTSAVTTLQRGLEKMGALLPSDQRYRIERKCRGYLEYRKLRACDYAIVSYGKSGRTWLRVLLSRLYQTAFELSDELLEFDNLHQQNPAVPKILFTHDNYLRDHTHDGHGKQAYQDTPTVLLVRNPADVATSQYFQWQNRMRRHKAELNGYPDQREPLTPAEFLLGPSGVRRVIDFMNEWASYTGDNDQVLVVRYEDLRAETARELSRISSFLGLPARDEWIEEAVEFASFENMRRRESADASDSARLKAADPSNPDSFKSRRAKVGGYRDYLTPEQAQALDQLVTENLDPDFGYATD